MYCEVLPAIRLPRKLTTFTYLVPREFEDKIKIGQVVETTFRGQKVQGVIMALPDKINFPARNLKAISKILSPETLVTEKQIKFFQWLADYYFSAFPLILKSALPAIPKKRSASRRAGYKFTEYKKPENKILPPKNDSAFLIYQNTRDKNSFFESIIAENLAAKKQTLILVPELKQLKDAGHYLRPEWREETVVIHGKLNKNEAYAAWQKIMTGEAKIIVGTRLAIFEPFQNLGAIIVDDEHDSDFKQWDMNPRYDARAAAEKLAALFRAKLFLVSPCPTVERYERFKDKVVNLKTEKKINLTLLDLRQQFSKRYSLISAPLREKMLETLKNKKQIIIYTNRRGAFSSVICATCGHSFLCPDCHLPLPYHRPGNLICHHCRHREKLPATCPRCGGGNYRFLGTGGEKIEKELKNLWPDARVAIIDSENRTPNQNANIFIGTDLIFKKISWQNVGLVAIVWLDNLLNLPDYRALERIYETLKTAETKTISETLSAQAGASGLGAELVIQTQCPNNPVFQALVKNQPEIFYDFELTNRRDLGYPPFAKLIKLIYQHPNEKKAIFESNRLFRQLTKMADGYKIKIQIFEPIASQPAKIRGRWRYHVIIKYKEPVSVTRLIAAVPDTWLIDVEPETLL